MGPPKYYFQLHGVSSRHAARSSGSAGRAVDGVAAKTQKVVSLSQAAAANNTAYWDNCQQLDSNKPPISFGEGVDRLNESIDTYGTKSPERIVPSNSPSRAAKNRTAMEVTKSIYEETCNTIGTDQQLIEEYIEHLRSFRVQAMSRKRSKSTSRNVVEGIQSLPATDTARKSKRIESCPTGRTAAVKAKKRVANKPPSIEQSTPR